MYDSEAASPFHLHLEFKKSNKYEFYKPSKLYDSKSIFSPLVAVPRTLTSVTLTVVKNFISTTPAPFKKIIYYIAKFFHYVGICMTLFVFLRCPDNI